MSDKFNIRSWVRRTLTRESGACIGDENRLQQQQGVVSYYALAEDENGEHMPYPLMPRWAQLLFRGRLLIDRISANVKVRGVNWHFICPVCQGENFYTLKDNYCEECGTEFDENGIVTGTLGDG